MGRVGVRQLEHQLVDAVTLLKALCTEKTSTNTKPTALLTLTHTRLSLCAALQTRRGAQVTQLACVTHSGPARIVLLSCTSLLTASAMAAPCGVPQRRQVGEQVDQRDTQNS
jgi:hypothetical protein